MNKKKKATEQMHIDQYIRMNDLKNGGEMKLYVCIDCLKALVSI